MSSPEPLLSICIPTYNRKFMLERSVDFHLREFRRLGIPFEIVIVDDCSTDETADYVETITGNPEVHAFRRSKNSGFLSNYAFAMRRARGKYATFLGDDDLLIPDTVLQYVQLMEGDPSVGCIQAPWMLMDGRPGGGEMGPFYRIAYPTRHQKGDFQSALRMIFENHVFPEFMIIRRDVLSKSISGVAPFIFWAFLFTTRALDKADVLFMPEPFARVTAVSDDPRLQQGNRECMFEWDTYRGGLEYLASHAFANGLIPPEGRGEIAAAINRFMLVRQSVALRLHINAKNWAEAYVLYHRMAAYQNGPLNPESYQLVCRMAGIVTAAREACDFSDQPVILDPIISDDMVGFLPQSLQARLTREIPKTSSDKPQAWLRFVPNFPPNPKSKDGVFDLQSYIDQFV
jgi:glycosyltransferase involved in cell wall biosynthesis